MSPPENSRRFVRTVEGLAGVVFWSLSVLSVPVVASWPALVDLEAQELLEEVEEEEEDVRETVIPLKQRDNSAAARLVKLTSADMPPLLLLLRQAARSPPRIQAVLTNGQGPVCRKQEKM